MKTVSVIVVQLIDSKLAITTELNVTAYTHEQDKDKPVTLLLARLNNDPSLLTSVIAYRVVEGDLYDDRIVEQYGPDNAFELTSPFDRDHFKVDVSKMDLGPNFQWVSKWIDLLNKKQNGTGSGADQETKAQKDEVKTDSPWATVQIPPEVKDQVKQRRTITLRKELGVGMSDDGIIANTHALIFRSKRDPIDSRVYWSLTNLKSSIKGNVDFSIGVVKSIEMTLCTPNSNPLVTMEVTVNDIAEEKLICELNSVSFFYDKDTDSTYWFLNN